VICKKLFKKYFLNFIKHLTNDSLLYHHFIRSVSDFLTRVSNSDSTNTLNQQVPADFPRNIRKNKNL
jgi:hypothetical protein